MTIRYIYNLEADGGFILHNTMTDEYCYTAENEQSLEFWEEIPEDQLQNVENAQI